VERLSELDYQHDPLQREIHEYRYRVAASFTAPGDIILDAACGIAYARHLFDGPWVGVDRAPSAEAQSRRLTGDRIIDADLNSWSPDFGFDVFVGLETIEHLAVLNAYVAAAKRARHTIVISTPIIPTRHFNPWHLQDFTRESLEALFIDDVWRLVHFEGQIDPLVSASVPTYGIWAFGR
jgi:hypothetical protein